MPKSRRRAVTLSAALALALATACTNAAVDKAVGSADGTPQVVIERTSSGVTVQNGVGRPLLNVRMAIEPGGTDAAFVYLLPTLDAGATRTIPFNDFRTEEGALFEPGYFAPKQIKATARDTLGNSYDAAVPW